MPDDSVTTDSPTPTALRATLEALIVADLLGPVGGEHEALPGNERVSDRYLLGLLAPRGTIAADPQRIDDDGVDADDSLAEPAEGDALVAAPMLQPSSFGLTCAVSASAGALSVTATWGRYAKEQDPTGAEGRDGRPARVWRRYPGGGAVTVALAEGDVGPCVPDPGQPEVVVRGRCRRRGGVWLLSLFLVN